MVVDAAERGFIENISGGARIHNHFDWNIVDFNHHFRDFRQLVLAHDIKLILIITTAEWFSWIDSHLIHSGSALLRTLVLNIAS